MAELKFGPISGKAREKKTVSAKVEGEHLFFSRRLVATDSDNGMSTRIGKIVVAGKDQRPVGAGGTLTLFFGNNALGNHLKWDVATPGDEIALEVEFIVDSTWSATLSEEPTT